MHKLFTDMQPFRLHRTIFSKIQAHRREMSPGVQGGYFNWLNGRRGYLPGDTGLLQMACYDQLLQVVDRIYNSRNQSGMEMLFSRTLCLSDCRLERIYREAGKITTAACSKKK